jgi:hypothetical protein
MDAIIKQMVLASLSGHLMLKQVAQSTSKI